MSPPDSNGRQLEAISSFALGDNLYDLFPVELASPTNGSFIYETFAGPLQDPAGAIGVFDLYKAQRGEGGWDTNERISPSPTSLSWPAPGGFSEDHEFAFSNDNRTDYLRSPSGSFELTGLGSLADEPYAQGRYISASGKHVIFTTGSFNFRPPANPYIVLSGWCFDCPVQKLEPNAPPAPTGAIYDRSADGPTHVLSLLPGDKTPAAGENAFYLGVSRDASSVAFLIGTTLYLRVDNGSATERTEEVATGEPTFGGLSNDGRYLIYVDGGTIHRFDTATEADEEINPGTSGQLVNVSADGSHLYFVSEEEIEGQGETGQPNLFVWRSSGTALVATVAASDLVRTSGSQNGFPALTNWASQVTNPPSNGASQGPGADSSRTTPDGKVLIFESRAQLKGYDNAGHTEIYRYDDSDESLECVSCNPQSAPATRDARLQELERVESPIVLNNLSADGTRVFFETPEALVAEDTNGINDVYEWQEGTTKPRLISSGKSPSYPLPEGVSAQRSAPLENILMAISPSGSDVFFIAKEALVDGAGKAGTEAIYDARENGGFPAPSMLQICAEEACHSSVGSPPTASPTPASEAITGTGNLKPQKHRCRHRKAARQKHACPKPHSKHRRRVARVSAASGANGSAAAQPVEPVGPIIADSGPAAGGSDARATTAASEPDFGIEKAEALSSSSQAGAHPDFITTFVLKHFKKSGGQESATASAENVQVQLPPGLLANPNAVPTCDIGDFVSYANCSPDSQVGLVRVKAGDPVYEPLLAPIFDLTPPHPDREVARFGFMVNTWPVFIAAKVKTASDYGAVAEVQDAPGVGAVIEATTVLWGKPSDSSHDLQRFKQREAVQCRSLNCKMEKPRPSSIPEEQSKGFMVNPSACQGGSINFSVTAYQLPGQVFEKTAPLAPITECSGLPFAPEFSADPTSHVAGAPTGLRTKLTIPQHLGAEERATSTMREARVTLPEGMQVAAGAANWIGTCSDDQVGFHEEVDTNCPDSSKLGTATIVSPAISTPIEGTIYQRSPEPGHQLGLWLTADALGLHIKLPGSLEPDKSTGRLTAVFSDLPQVPVEEIDLNVWGGPRAPLQNPDHCGTFTTDFSFTPHSDDPAATGQSTMAITEGCDQPFAPTLHAGVTEPTAGKFSPFVFDLTRPDSDQALRGFELHLPEGAIGKPKGVPLCGDAEAAAASCPEDSRIGSLQATTGPGPEPFTIPAPGKAQPQIYFAGPYQGAPFSIVSEVPAQAGPFDLGTLAVRSALKIDPETAKVTVKADPLPQFFEGVGIAYRNLHAVVDRPEFFLNPTNCSELAVSSDVTSTQGAVAHPQARFQVDGCKALKFKPALSLKLRGGTKRAQYPALTAVLKARKGDANIAFTSVALPHSEFLAQEHIGTICTRVQFAADKCPKGSVYGSAKAITPLLDRPLSGSVYLRSSNHPLPDLVAKLGGQLEIDLVGRIDSVHGGIRATFESVPDAPVTKFVMHMKGGAKSLITNSTDICRGSRRATVQMKAQNGRAARLRPRLQAKGCGAKKKRSHKHHR